MPRSLFAISVSLCLALVAGCGGGNSGRDSAKLTGSGNACVKDADCPSGERCDESKTCHVPDPGSTEGESGGTEGGGTEAGGTEGGGTAGGGTEGGGTEGGGNEGGGGNPDAGSAGEPEQP